MTDRERFEAWAVSRDLSLRVGDGISAPDYRDSYTYYAYDAWQASRKQALEEALDVCSKLGDREENIGRHSEAFGCDLCVHALACLAKPEGEQG